MEKSVKVKTLIEFIQEYSGISRCDVHQESIDTRTDVTEAFTSIYVS